MDSQSAIRALSALSQPTRLAAFRALMRAGSDGLLAGEIARTLAVRQNTLSTHLSLMQTARLVATDREGRAIRYRIDLAGLRSLLAFLLQDCCGGQPEMCGPVIEAIAWGCGDEGADDTKPAPGLEPHVRT